jgi:hypothetical protein
MRREREWEQYSRQDGHEMMAECRPVEAPEFALRSADDHAAGRVGEAVELTISPSASRSASSILSSVVVISARSRLGFFLRRAEVRSWRQAAYEVDPPKGSSRRKAAVAEISLWNPGGRT